MLLNKMLEIYIWQLMRKVLHRCFKIRIFESKTKSCLLHASEFPKMCNYLVQFAPNYHNNLKRSVRKIRVSLRVKSTQIFKKMRVLIWEFGPDDPYKPN